MAAVEREYIHPLLYHRHQLLPQAHRLPRLRHQHMGKYPNLKGAVPLQLQPHRRA